MAMTLDELEAAKRLEKAYTVGGTYSGTDPITVARALLAAARENERMREVMRTIIKLDHHNHGPESRATILARAALKETT